MYRINDTGKRQIIFKGGSEYILKPGQCFDDSEFDMSGLNLTRDFPIIDMETHGRKSPTNANVYAVYNILDDITFLKESILSIYDYVDGIIFQYGGNWWSKQLTGGDRSLSLLDTISDDQHKIYRKPSFGFSGSGHQGQLGQRTAGFDPSIMQEGDWYWIVDSDEIYTYEAAQRLVELLKSGDSDFVEGYSIRMFAYYQDLNTIGWEEWCGRAYRFRRGRSFTGVNVCSDGEFVVKTKHLPDDIICHHLSYVKPDADIFNKVADYEYRWKRGNFKEVKLSDFKNTWFLNRETDLYDIYVHPIKEYTNKKTRPAVVENFPEVLIDSHYRNNTERRVTIVVVSYFSSSPIHKMLHSFYKCKPVIKNVEIDWIFIDNGSGDLQRLKFYLEECREQYKYNQILIENDSNLLFTRAVNQGIELATGNYILLLNPDIIFTQKDWLLKMLYHANEYPNVGVLSCRQDNGHGLIHFGGGIIKNGKFVHEGRNEFDTKVNYTEVKETEWVTGSCFLITRKCLNAIGSLDPAYKHYDSDNKYCVKAREHHFKVLYCGDANITHYCGKSVEKNNG